MKNTQRIETLEHTARENTKDVDAIRKQCKMLTMIIEEMRKPLAKVDVSDMSNLHATTSTQIINEASAAGELRNANLHEQIQNKKHEDRIAELEAENKKLANDYDVMKYAGGVVERVSIDRKDKITELEAKIEHVKACELDFMRITEEVKAEKADLEIIKSGLENTICVIEKSCKDLSEKNAKLLDTGEKLARDKHANDLKNIELEGFCVTHQNTIVSLCTKNESMGAELEEVLQENSEFNKEIIDLRAEIKKYKDGGEMGYNDE